MTPEPLSPASLRSPTWHGGQGESRASGAWVSWLAVIIPLLAVGILLLLGHRMMAIVVAVISLALLVARSAHPSARAAIDRGLNRFANGVTRVVSYVLLAIPFFLILTPMRLWNGLFGKDPLLLRNDGRHTHWQASESPRRKQRMAKAMMAAEPIASHRMRLLPWVMVAMVAALASEGLLRTFGMGKPLLFQQDPEIAYYPAPNQAVRYPGRTIETNRYGMRSTNFAMPKPPGVYRILLTGDSTLAGTKVANDQLYSYLLEKNLQARHPEQKIEVLNMGVNAWGPLHQLAYIRKFGTFDADAAIICGPVANVFRPKYGLERLPFFSVHAPPKTAWGHALHEVIWRLRERKLGAPFWAMEGAAQDEQAQAGAKAYAELAALYQSKNMPVFLAMMPARHVMLGDGDDVFGQRHFRTIRSAIPAEVEVDLAGAIFKNQSERERIFYDGVHFDVLGHQLYAEYLTEKIERAGWLDAAP